MKPASLSQLKQELKHKSKEELIELSLALTKYKKENKELLTYLIFEASDELSFIRDVKSIIDEEFLEINKKTPYLLTKNIRKILRNIKKFIRYSKKKPTEIELLLHFCKKLKDLNSSIKPSTAILNIYDRQVALIIKTVENMHEDLQFDYEDELKIL